MLKKQACEGKKMDNFLSRGMDIEMQNRGGRFHWCHHHAAFF